jgi:hypothetical protein
MKVPLGSIILRTSEDFAISSQAAWIAASRDFTARDLGSPPCSAKTTCHIIQSSLPRCCAHRCPSYRDQGKLHRARIREPHRRVARVLQCGLDARPGNINRASNGRAGPRGRDMMTEVRLFMNSQSGGWADWNEVCRRGQGDVRPRPGFCCRPASSSIFSPQTRGPGPTTTSRSVCRIHTDGPGIRPGICRFRRAALVGGAGLASEPVRRVPLAHRRGKARAAARRDLGVDGRMGSRHRTGRIARFVARIENAACQGVATLQRGSGRTCRPFRARLVRYPLNASSGDASDLGY